MTSPYHEGAVILWPYLKHHYLAPMALHTSEGQCNAIYFEVYACFLNLTLLIDMFITLNVHVELKYEL